MFRRQWRQKMPFHSVWCWLGMSKNTSLCWLDCQGIKLLLILYTTKSQRAKSAHKMFHHTQHSGFGAAISDHREVVASCWCVVHGSGRTGFRPWCGIVASSCNKSSWWMVTAVAQGKEYKAAFFFAFFSPALKPNIHLELHLSLWNTHDRNATKQRRFHLISFPLSSLHPPAWTRTAMTRAVCPAAWTTYPWLPSRSSPSSRRVTRMR